MNKIFSKSRGQVMIMYAVAIGGLLAAVALGTDVAVMYVNWQQVRKAADSGALAAADQFEADVNPNFPAFTNVGTTGCGSSPATTAAGCTIAVNNGAASSEVNVQSPAPSVPASVPAQYASQTVQVTVNRTDIPVFFARAMGLTTPYQANATAIAVGPLPLNGAKNPFPAGIPKNPNGQPITYGTQFTLTNADPNKNGLYGAGNWGWLDIGGTGASNLQTVISNGCSCDLTVGQSITPKTGESWGPVSSAVDALITNPGLAPANLTGNESQLVTVPIVTPFTNGATAVTILGFAEVWLVSDIQKNGNGQTLTVEFLQYVPKDGLAGGGPNNFGAYSKPALVQ